MKRDKIKKILFRAWFYMRRGHSVYFAFLISFLNFIVIQYRLLVEKVPLLQMIFPRFWIFVISFFLVYVPLVVIIGWWDTKRGVYKEESRILWERNPVAKDLTDRVRRLEEKLNKILEILEERKEK